LIFSVVQISDWTDICTRGAKIKLVCFVACDKVTDISGQFPDSSPTLSHNVPDILGLFSPVGFTDLEIEQILKYKNKLFVSEITTI
jgi:hypothetical protein